MVIARDLKTFVVPTRTLLEQTVRELAWLVPGVRIGSYGAGRDHVVPHGVNVTTYAMLQAHAAELRWSGGGPRWCSSTRRTTR